MNDTKPRLIAFGCSFTYGHGLPDCYVKNMYPGTEPSKFAWPELLAQLTDRICVNKASCGASNKEIWYDIHKFEFEPQDLVFVHWSFYHRSCILHPNGIAPIAHWMIDTDQNSNTFFKKFYSEYEQYTDFCLRARDIASYLDSIQISNHMIRAPRHTTNQLTDHHIIHRRPLMLNTPNITFIATDSALDGKHPGPKSHAKFAQLIFDEITNQ